MLLHAYQNAQLQVGTNSYWYDKFVPENLQAIEIGANAFESSKRLGSNEPCGPTGEVERPHAGE